LCFSASITSPKPPASASRAPNREPKHLAKLLADRLFVIDPGFGIESASLTASWVEAIVERQTVGRHVGGDDAEVDVSQLVDTLGVRLGQNKIYRAMPVESGLPERAARRVAALHPAQDLAWPDRLPRPARLLVRPEKIEAVAQLPDHPPRLFIWRKVRYRVAQADGPERIRGEWWTSESETNLVRDYYRVETADGTRGSGLDSREPKPPVRSRDIYEPDLHIDTLKVRARNFR
jgi:protein ImuB